MEPDYPAAHSMDTFWFATDRDGRVAMFFSGEDGAVPADSRATNHLELLELLAGDPSAEELDFDNLQAQAARLGLFCYSLDPDPEIPLQGTYRLDQLPSQALHVDSLPPAFRSPIKAIRFDNLRFADAAQLQPVEHVECAFWVGEHAVAFLAADRVTVRPIPGREGRFAAFCEQLRREYPQKTAGLRFEGLPGPEEPGQ
jgi:hypothetical protein